MNLFATATYDATGFVSAKHFFDGYEITAAEYGAIFNAAVARCIDEDDGWLLTEAG